MNNLLVIVYFVIVYILKYYFNVKYVVEVRLYVFCGYIILEMGYYF